MTPDEAITIVSTACAIPSCPATDRIDMVYHSARRHLPFARWLFLFDGVHEIQEDMRDGYEKYKKILAMRMISGEWINCDCMIFSEWGHQGSAIRQALRLDRIHTPLVLWLENDFPFNGLPIPWQEIVDCLLANELCYMRFCLPEETHESVKRIDWEHSSNFGLPICRTFNYSSLPNVCRLDFLQALVACFKVGKCHLESEISEGIAIREPEKWRLGVYTPPGQIDRVYSIDGREGRQKPQGIL